MNAADKSELLNVASKLRPELRAAFLDAACGDDVVLRQELGLPIDASTSTDSTTSQESSPGPEIIGQKIGRYRLLQAIGEGGCGVVYMAEQKLTFRTAVNR